MTDHGHVAALLSPTHAQMSMGSREANDFGVTHSFKWEGKIQRLFICVSEARL